MDFVWSNQDGFSRPPGDEVVNYIHGSDSRLTKLLSRIRVLNTSGNPVRTYQFEYDFQSESDPPAVIGRQSFLSAVTLKDRDGNPFDPRRS